MNSSPRNSMPTEELPSYAMAVDSSSSPFRTPTYRSASRRFSPYTVPRIPRYWFYRNELTEDMTDDGPGYSPEDPAANINRAVLALALALQGPESEENIRARNRLIIDLAILTQQRLDETHGPGGPTVKVILADDPRPSGLEDNEGGDNAA